MRTLLAAALAVVPLSSLAQTCVPLVAVATATLTVNQPPYYRYKIADGMISGGPGIDELTIEFNSSASTGIFNLAAGSNTNYRTCVQCVHFSRDYTTNFKFFYPSQGTLCVFQPLVTNPLTFTLSNTRLVEVTLAANFNSTPVPGGECYNLVGDQLFRSGFDS